ncbi:MAG: TetR/AcrR family transcriptional regulator [Oscillospiraceae bacterium]|jgi:AcrR family transcriptional regulator
MAEAAIQGSVRGRLIEAGLEELSRHGYHNFSVRRIANKCGVSCAAPYKHFKDKHSFIAAIIGHINSLWAERQQVIISKYPDSTRKQLVEISLDYIRFLVENPHFRSVLMLKDEEFDEESNKLRGQLSKLARELIKKYCDEVGMPDFTRWLKTYIIRSLIYGAALMFDNGELEYTEENMQAVYYAIDREFDLP